MRLALPYMSKLVYKRTTLKRKNVRKSDKLKVFSVNFTSFNNLVLPV